MPLTMKELVTGLKDIAKLAGAASGSMIGIGAAAVTITMDLKEHLDEEDKAYIADLMRREGCNHITTIHGLGTSLANMLNHVARNNGTAWRNSDSFYRYVYHEQDDFLPDNFTEFYRKSPPKIGLISTFTSKTGAISGKCKKCVAEADARERRSGHR